MQQKERKLQQLESEMSEALGLKFGKPRRERVKVVRSTWIARVSVRKLSNGSPYGNAFVMEVPCDKALSELDTRVYVSQQLKKMDLLPWVFLNIFVKETEI